MSPFPKPEVRGQKSRTDKARHSSSIKRQEQGMVGKGRETISKIIKEHILGVNKGLSKLTVY